MAEEKKEEQTQEEAAESKEEAAEAKAEETDASAETPKNDDASGQEEVEVPEQFKDLVSKIEEMTVLELSELVKVLEDKFGVSSAAPVVAAGGAAAGGEEAAGEESSTVTVELTDGGSNKIAVIKALRGVLPDLGLKDAKEFVEAAPKPVKEGVEKAEGEEIKSTLEEAGATVTLK